MILTIIQLSCHQLLPGFRSFSTSRRPFLRHWLYVLTHKLSVLQWVPFWTKQSPHFTAYQPVSLTVWFLLSLQTYPLPQLQESDGWFLNTPHSFSFYFYLISFLYTNPPGLILFLVNPYSSFKAQVTHCPVKLYTLFPSVLYFPNDFIFSNLNIFPTRLGAWSGQRSCLSHFESFPSTHSEQKNCWNFIWVD